MASTGLFRGRWEIPRCTLRLQMAKFNTTRFSISVRVLQTRSTKAMRHCKSRPRSVSSRSGSDHRTASVISATFLAAGLIPQWERRRELLLRRGSTMAAATGCGRLCKTTSATTTAFLTASSLTFPARMRSGRIPPRQCNLPQACAWWQSVSRSESRSGINRLELARTRRFGRSMKTNWR